MFPLVSGGHYCCGGYFAFQPRLTWALVPVYPGPSLGDSSAGVPTDSLGCFLGQLQSGPKFWFLHFPQHKMAGNSALLFKPFYNCFVISYPCSLVCEHVEGKPMPFGPFLCHLLSLEACPSWLGCLAAPDSASAPALPGPPSSLPLPQLTLADRRQVLGKGAKCYPCCPCRLGVGPLQISF